MLTASGFQHSSQPCVMSNMNAVDTKNVTVFTISILCTLIYLLNRNWVATRWQLYSTHLHTNNTQNDTKKSIHRTT
jgi:hypothetical protein